MSGTDFLLTPKERRRMSHSQDTIQRSAADYEKGAELEDHYDVPLEQAIRPFLDTAYYI